MKTRLSCPGGHTWEIESSVDAWSATTERMACPVCRGPGSTGSSEPPLVLGTPELSVLLRRWEEGQQRGEALSPEELCRDCPELLEPLRQNLQALAAMDALMPSGPYATVSHQPAVDPYATEPDPSAAGRSTAAGPRSCIPGYEVLGELGRGAMGVVYRARQVKLQRIVALKMILAGEHAGSAELARFRTEAEAIARLAHPNIVQIYEVGEHDGLPFFSLEFCAGGSLARKLAGTPLPAREAAAVVAQLAHGMHAAHEKGVIHRDLKPGNVLLASPGVATPGLADQPKITDFGLAKKLDEQGKTVSGAIMGTPSYMAPEQAAGKINELGPACDIYALGAILYECLTGRPPFKAATMMDTLRQVMNEEPVRPMQLQSGTPRDLETICLKCLQKEPARRYATAAALADDLRRYLNREPILARPTPAWERLAKWARRKPAVAGLVSVSLLALVAGIAVAILYGILSAQELQQFKDQEAARQQVRDFLAAGKRHLDSGEFGGAERELAQGLAALEAQPGLDADALHGEVRELLDLARTRLQARTRFEQFRKPHDDALFLCTRFTGLDMARDRTRIRAACRAALALYGPEADGPAAQLARDRPALKPQEHARLVAGCYELLLIWAEMEADTAPARDGARAALAVLAHAERLAADHDIRSRTAFLYKARVMAQSRGEPFDAAAAERAAPPPDTRLDWFLAALAHYQRGQQAEVISAAERVLDRDEADFWARYVKAMALLSQGEWLAARTELSICMQLGQHTAWPRLMRGHAATEMADYAAAAQDLDLGLKRDPDPLVQYVGLTYRGTMNVRRRRFDQAITDLRQALAANPAGVEASLTLARAHLEARQWNEALAVLDGTLERVPQMAALYDSRAQVHERRKDLAAARADLEQAIARYRRAGQTDRAAMNLTRLGELWQRDGKHAAAVQRFDEALRLAPRDTTTHLLRGQSLLALDPLDRSGKAARALDRYLKLARPPRPDALVARGLLYAQSGKRPEAVEMYTLALARDPHNNKTRCHRGWAYLTADAPRLALADFAACLDDAALDAAIRLDALVGRGTVRIQLRQTDDALADATAAAAALAAQPKITPKPAVLYFLARLHAQAAGQLEQQARKEGPAAAQRTAQRQAACMDAALDYLRQAVDALPPTERLRFWHEQVHGNAALAALWNDNRYVLLAGRCAATGP
jgi:serine/threonine protein kinase/predicted Zn-dependent protease